MVKDDYFVGFTYQKQQSSKEHLAKLHVAEIVKLFGEALRALTALHSSKENKC